MGQYYFAGTAIPGYNLESPTEYEFEVVKDLMRTNLSKKDYEKTVVVRRYFDIENIRCLWKKEEFDPYGNLDPNALEEALLAYTGLPEYVYDFLEKYDTIEERLKHFPELVAAYFREEIEKASGFLKEYLEFERAFRLVMVGLRAKELGRDVTAELQFEDPNDDLVAQIIAQKDSPTYVPPGGFEDLKPLLEEMSETPLELHKALLKYKFRKYEEMVGLAVFSIDRMLAYLVEHILTAKWFALNKKKGHEMIETIVQGEK